MHVLEPEVTRANIDAFSTSLSQSTASRGAIFTTKGYQRGAITIAKQFGIRLFVIQLLSGDDEGESGRDVRGNFRVRQPCH